MSAGGAEPTPRPWRVVVERDEILIEGPEPADPDSYPDVVHQAIIYSWDTDEMAAWKEANARLIVEAVNAAAGF